MYGKRPDNLTLLLRREGRCLVWDVSIANTASASYLQATLTETDSVTELAASRIKNLNMETNLRVTSLYLLKLNHLDHWAAKLYPIHLN